MLDALGGTSSSCPRSTDPEKKKMTAECELLPPVGCGKFDRSAFEGTELVSGTGDLSPGGGNVWNICDPEDPDCGKSMDLRGQSYLADRAEAASLPPSGVH